MTKDEERDLMAQLTGLVRSARMVARGCYALVTVIDPNGITYTTHVHTPHIAQADAERITSAVMMAMEEEVEETRLQARAPKQSHG